MERENETVHGCTSKQTNVESQCRERVSHPEQLMTKQWTVLSCKVRTLINDVSQSLHTTPASALCHRPHTHTHTHQQLIGKHQLCSVQLGGGLSCFLSVLICCYFVQLQQIKANNKARQSTF